MDETWYYFGVQGLEFIITIVSSGIQGLEFIIT